jgi:hypothetical protein
MAMPNPYLRRLEERYNYLRAERVNLRKCIAHYSGGPWRHHGSAVDTQIEVRRLNEMFERNTFEWEKVCHALGRDPHPRPVKLALGRKDREALRRQALRPVVVNGR